MIIRKFVCKGLAAGGICTYCGPVYRGLVIFWNKNHPDHPCNAFSIHHFKNRRNLWQVSSHSPLQVPLLQGTKKNYQSSFIHSNDSKSDCKSSFSEVVYTNKPTASFQVWDVRSDQVVRSIHGPYICGDGIDIWEDSVLTASWVARDALQVRFIRKSELMLSYKHFFGLFLAVTNSFFYCM